MKISYRSLRLYILLITAVCAGNMHGAVQSITGGQFYPPLVPTTNSAETADGNIYNRVIVDDATLTGIEINQILYTDIEGPTNATATTSGGRDYWPIHGTEPGSFAAAITNLTLRFFNALDTCDVFFESTVTTETDGGFFFCEFGSSDDVYVYPLGSDGEPISTWQLYLDNNDYGADRLLFPHGDQLYVEWTEGVPDVQQDMGGAAFTLKDFTGGSGLLNNVTGLRVVDAAHECDPCMIGIYRGPGESVFYRAGRAVPLRNPTFDQTLTNPMTNDFALTGFDGAASIVGPASVNQFDTRSDSSVIWPVNGVQPAITNALLGLNINGVDDFEYWEFMFAEPVTNAAEGFFIIDERTHSDPVLIFPLDADRNPISTYSIVTVPTFYQWGDLLNQDVHWDGPVDDTGDSMSRLGGVRMPLSAFAGGSGGLSEVHGIRVCAYPLKWDSKRLDPLVVGSYTAWKQPLPVYDIETDPMPTPTPSATLLGGYIRHDWTLTSITLESGRYTDLKGPASATGVGGDYWYPVDGTDPGSGAAAVLGLDGSGLVNDDAVSYFFDTTITNGFDGGFFVFESGGEDSYSFTPIGVDSNIISGYTVVIDKDRDMFRKVENHMGILCTLRRSNGEIHNRDHYGAAFTLNCFTNGVGESLTNDVIGLKIKYNVSGNADILMVGMYKGPVDPSESGIGSAITTVTFDPLPQGSPYTNDVDIASVQSIYSESDSVSGPSSVAILSHSGDRTYYPVGGTDPGDRTAGYTNAILGLSINGFLQSAATEHMFDRPLRQPDDGFFIIEHSGNDFIKVRPLGADRSPISTYSIRIDQNMYGHVGSWTMSIGGATMRGTMIRRCDFAGGSGDPGLIYGIRIEEPGGEFDPAVVGQYFGPLQGTVILVR